MRSTLPFVFSLLSATAWAAPGAEPISERPNILLRAACNADNCARAVTGTIQGSASLAQHTSDCKSFLQCTAYPATSTVTATTTVTSVAATSTVFPFTSTLTTTVTTVPVVDTTVSVTDTTTVSTTDVVQTTVVQLTTITNNINARRSVTAASPSSGSVVCKSAVPTYASACSGTVRYSSACSCFGFTAKTTTQTTPTTTVTVTATAFSTTTLSLTATATSDVSATTFLTVTSTVITTQNSVITTTSATTTVSTVTVAAPTGNAYCENGQPVNGLSAACTTVGCSTTNLRIEGASGTIYEGTILAGPRNITTASGGTHLCDGTNNNANPVPFDNGISTIDAASGLCGFTYDGTFSQQFDDFFIQRIGDTTQTGSQFWGILLNYVFTPAGGCETEVLPTDELLWAFNAFNVNYFLRVEPTQTPVVLAPGQSTTFTIQGSDGNGDPFVNIAGASFNGQTSDANGNVPFTAPTTPGTYRYKATRSDSIRSNAVTIVVQG